MKMFKKIYIISIIIVMLAISINGIYLHWVIFEGSVSWILIFVTLLVLFFLKSELMQKLSELKSSKNIRSKNESNINVDDEIDNLFKEINHDVQQSKSNHKQFLKSKSHHYKIFKNEHTKFFQFLNKIKLEVSQKYPYLEVQIKETEIPYPELEIRIKGNETTRYLMYWDAGGDYYYIFNLKIFKDENNTCIYIKVPERKLLQKNLNEIELTVINDYLKSALTNAVNKIENSSSYKSIMSDLEGNNLRTVLGKLKEK